jgi:mannose-6-phosphate isomerase-like protein (cupin superfamily)
MSDAPVHRKLQDLRKFSIAAGDSVKQIYLAGPAEGSRASVYFEVWDPLGSQPVNSHPGSCEVFVILSGKGRAYSDDRVIDLSPGDVLVLPEKSSHRIENLSATERMYAVTVMVDDALALDEADRGFAQLVTQGLSESLDPLDLLALFTQPTEAQPRKRDSS